MPPRVLVVGVDPRAFPEWDPEPVLAALDRGQRRCADAGLRADLCLLDASGAEPVVSALRAAQYRCVVIGGGLRAHEPLLALFEEVVNVVRVHAPAAAIAFNSTPDDTAAAALRWL